MIYGVNAGSKGDRLWHYKDESGAKVTPFLSIHVADSKEGDCRLLSLIIGPLHFYVGWMIKRKTTPEPVEKELLPQ